MGWRKLSKNKWRWILIIIIVLLIVGVCIAVPILRQSQSGLQLDSNASAWEPTTSIQTTEEQGIQIPGYGTIYFAAGEKDVPITLYNPEENTCNFVFELSIEGDEPFYQTGLVEPGKAVTEISLKNPFTAGNYKMHILVKAYDQDGNSLNSGDVKTTLVVQ